MDSMFETLVDLPLFRGVTRERMAEVIEKAKFHFLKYTPDNDIVIAGQQQTHLSFLFAGSVRLTVTGGDSRFRVTSVITAPDVIAPDFIFGRHTTSPCTATAIDTVSLLSISKTDYLDMLQRDGIFLLNYLNLLSMNAQKSVVGVISLTTASIEERIAFWIIALTQSRAKDIVLHCRQRDLCSIFGIQRSALVTALESLRERGIITYTNESISFLNRHDLVSLLTHTEDDD